MQHHGSHPRTLHCSFCGKSQHEVERLIAGPTVFICNKCIVYCVTLLIRDGITCDLGESFRRLIEADESSATSARVVARKAKRRQELSELNRNSPWSFIPDTHRELPKERLGFMLTWRRFQDLLIEACPSDLEFVEYLGEHLTREEVFALFEQACGGPGSRFNSGIKMMFDATAEEIAAPFDRVIRLLRLAREGQPEIPLT
jgi:hypothetical protein